MSTRLLVLLLVISVLTFYTVLRVGHVAPKRRRALLYLTAAVALVALAPQFVYRSDLLELDSVAFYWLNWIGLTLLGLWGTFLLLSIPIDLAAAPFFFIRPNASRRAFIRRAVPSGLLAASTGISAWGLKTALAGPVVRQVRVPIEGLPPELEGFTIAQISDLHVGPTIDRKYVEEVVATVQSLSPRMIAVTGDLADGTPGDLRGRLEPLAGLSAQHGVFYVTGNHEYYWNGPSWIQAARDLGFMPLVNSNFVVPVDGRKILVAGVTDTSSRQFIETHVSDPMAAARTSETVDLKILLAHRPDSCFAAEPAGYHLQLSGHTHAGQFFPWRMLMPLAHKYWEGLNRHGKGWVYVNAGTGYWGPPHRFAVPSEITLLSLASSAR